jgi:hypothetical protein
MGDQWIYKWKLEKAPLSAPFLESIVDFLHVKKEQAQFLLSYLYENPFKRGQRLTNEQLLYREKAYLKMHDINSCRDMKSRLITKQEVICDAELFWPYVAGLLDTDGSFSIKKEKRDNSYRYSPNILLTLVNVNAINYIKKNSFYGSCHVIKSGKISQGFCYRFGVFQKEEVISFIKNILPYLTHKKEAAEILLQFCEGFVAQCGQYLKTDEQIDFREDCYQRLCYFNRYGVSKSSLIDLEPLPGDAEGNKGQAAQACSLNVASGKTSQEDAVL